MIMICNCMQRVKQILQNLSIQYWNFSSSSPFLCLYRWADQGEYIAKVRGAVLVFLPGRDLYKKEIYTHIIISPSKTDNTLWCGY